MNSINTEHVLVPAYHVRRRKYNDEIWLISYNQYFKIDEAVDIIWLLCDGSNTIKDIIKLFKKKSGLPLGEAAAAVVTFSVNFINLDLIHIKDGHQ